MVQSLLSNIAFRLSKKSSSGFSSKPFNNKDFMFFPIAIFGSTEYDFTISLI